MGRVVITAGVSIAIAANACGGPSPRPAPATTSAACQPRPVSEPAERRVWSYFAECLRPSLLARVDAGERVLGLEPSYVRAMLTTGEPPVLRADPPGPGRQWSPRVRQDVAAFGDVVVVGDVADLLDDASYERVELTLRTAETPTDGGLSLTFFVGVRGVVLGYRVLGG